MFVIYPLCVVFPPLLTTTSPPTFHPPSSFFHSLILSLSLAHSFSLSLSLPRCAGLGTEVIPHSSEGKHWCPEGLRSPVCFQSLEYVPSRSLDPPTPTTSDIPLPGPRPAECMGKYHGSGDGEALGDGGVEWTSPLCRSHITKTTDPPTHTAPLDSTSSHLLHPACPTARSAASSFSDCCYRPHL